MTFHARLSELLEKAKTSRLSFNDLQDLLTDHAEAIRDLVVAADAVIARWDTPTWKDAEPTAHTINAMREALAKLDQE